MDIEVNCELYVGTDPLEALIDVNTCRNNDISTKNENRTDINNSYVNNNIMSIFSVNYNGTLKHSSEKSYPIDLNVKTSHLKKATSKTNESRTKVHPYHYTGPYIKLDKMVIHRKRCFQCPYNTCKRWFQHEAVYNLHLVMHRNRSLECELCQKVYQDKNILLKHQSQHHGEDGKLKSFQCSVPGCYHVYLSDTLLRDHESAEHKLYVELYTCDICSKTFTLKHSYLKHMHNHTSSRTIGCKECGKYFKSSDVLNLHMKLHRYSRDYVCQLCGLEFYKSSNLKRHEKTHEGENFFCEICFATFSHGCTLTRHINKHHPNARKKQLELTKRKKNQFFQRSKKDSLLIKPK